ncbi:PLDc N-terminal domain-containing protein [Amnibacterium sp. CER49]|uniref:PLDc N-terminal domain-containing protein n=1 Tax=Amnibacterium sp. CER49 TaxID=3039161 RepID=UPI00244CCF95|nr:PLDc N-terminal domain-containing protein [Amnibacterium sp. CER49]MDH2443408.1 PLDc N-terminal domain-containing protein [Amnibacterium sp. CER49]
MGRLIVGLVIVVLVCTIYAVVDCALTERYRVRALPKSLWLPVVLLLPVIGPALWFLLGRIPVRAARRLPPDDDPRFTGPSTRSRGPQRREPRIDLSRLEEELANLDGDADDDGDGRRR